MQNTEPKYETQPIVNCYDHWLVRAYCRVRFIILNQRFLREIGQYLPESGRVLDIGCGFGLFALTFASARRDISIHAVDLNSSRIEMARKAAAQLGIDNVLFNCGDVTQYHFEDGFSTAYMLDIVHHIPPDTVEPLLSQIHNVLEPSGRLILKDINVHPAYKRWFTWWLDKLMDYQTPVHYWPRQDLQALLKKVGFEEIYTHEMVDYLPYPHIIYVCNKSKSH